MTLAFSPWEVVSFCFGGWRLEAACIQGIDTVRSMSDEIINGGKYTHSQEEP